MRRAALALAALLLLGIAPARAELKLCNRTSYILYAATASIRNTQSSAQGWTRIAPGDCQTARKEALTAETYLVHARSSLAHSGPARAWGGNFPLCVKDADFLLNQSAAMAVCRSSDSFALPFAALDTQGARSWTMTLDESPALPSLAAAQLAGVKRLLRDTGYNVGAIDGAVSRQTGTALAAFRKRMNFPAQAGNAELFAALEKEALKTNAPSGYTVCNDARAPLRVALAQARQGQTGSRGWWLVPPGSCARAITTPLHEDAVYLLARTLDGKVVAGGKEMFCIAAAAFEAPGRGRCAERGFAEAGFARTQTRNSEGFVARIGEKGLAASGGAPKG
jgi:uncharacterized membrane protein